MSLSEDFLKTAHQNFSLWCDALLTKNPANVAKLYSQDSTFLPTLSSEFKSGISGAVEYFQHFLQQNPNCQLVTEAIQPLGSNCYLHSGMYNFQVDSNGGRQNLEARFSFVWERNSDQDDWKIAHHHSSLKP